MKNRELGAAIKKSSTPGAQLNARMELLEQLIGMLARGEILTDATIKTSLTTAEWYGYQVELHKRSGGRTGVVAPPELKPYLELLSYADTAHCRVATAGLPRDPLHDPEMLKAYKKATVCLEAILTRNPAMTQLLSEGMRDGDNGLPVVYPDTIPRLLCARPQKSRSKQLPIWEVRQIVMTDFLSRSLTNCFNIQTTKKDR